VSRWGTPDSIDDPMSFTDIGEQAPSTHSQIFDAVWEGKAPKKLFLCQKL